MSDMGFEKMLAEHNQAFAEAEAYTNWMPPDAEYIVMLMNVGTGSFTDNASGKVLPYWRLKGKILEEGSPLDGQEFLVGFYTARALGILKSAVSVLRGEVVSNLLEANKVLSEEAPGMIVRVKVETTERKGQTYKNATILERLQVSSEEQADPVGAGGEGASHEAPEAPAEA